MEQYYGIQFTVFVVELRKRFDFCFFIQNIRILIYIISDLTYSFSFNILWTCKLYIGVLGKMKMKEYSSYLYNSPNINKTLN